MRSLNYGHPWVEIQIRLQNMWGKHGRQSVAYYMYVIFTVDFNTHLAASTLMILDKRRSNHA